VTYFIKTRSQLPLILKAFRKEKGLTQAAMAERLGITQQGYAHFEANPASATLERLFLVLRLLNVEIGLSQTYSIGDKKQASTAQLEIAQNPAIYHGKARAIAARKVKPSVPAKASSKIASTRKKESW
jgi:HTH-type transcriptional regulator/antitoxin HipB